jgi:hypothetical protein
MRIRVRDLVNPGSGMGKNPEPGSGKNIPDIIFKYLLPYQFFGSKILEFFLMRIQVRDLDNPRSWIRDGTKLDPGYSSRISNTVRKVLLISFLFPVICSSVLPP